MWNLLSHKYSEVLIGLNGSNEKLTFFSFPSGVSTVPQYTTRPLSGTREYSFRRCCVDVIAASTDRRFTRDLMLLAVPYSCVSMLVACDSCDLGGRIKLIIDVPAPRAFSKLLMSFLTFQIWIF